MRGLRVQTMSDLKKLGKYEIQSVLGKGAMGVVYKAFDPNIERTVAIKTVRMDLVDPDLTTQFIGRFKNEARAAGRLHHPNIVGIYEYGEHENIAFISTARPASTCRTSCPSCRSCCWRSTSRTRAG